MRDVLVNRMYSDRRQAVSPFRGCGFNCIYCAFRGSLKRQDCKDCKEFRPHAHLRPLDLKPVITRGRQFVSIGLNGDISFANSDVMQKVIEYCERWKDRTFFLQSKNPARFLNFRFPGNVILATTIETNYDSIVDRASGRTVAYSEISKAPLPSQRFEAMKMIRSNDTIVTIEPIMVFDLDTMVNWIKEIGPKAVYVGYNSRDHPLLPEPSLAETERLIEALKQLTEVRPKLLRRAHWEPR